MNFLLALLNALVWLSLLVTALLGETTANVAFIITGMSCVSVALVVGVFKADLEA